MRSALIFIILIFFVWLKGLSSEPAKKSTNKRFAPGATSLKTKNQRQKFTGLQASSKQKPGRTTAAPPFQHNEDYLNHLPIDDVNHFDYGDYYESPGVNPNFPNYEYSYEGGEDQQWNQPQDFQRMAQSPDYDDIAEPDESAMEDEYHLNDRKRASKKAGKSIDQSAVSHSVRQKKQQIGSELRFGTRNKRRFKNKFKKLYGKSGSNKSYYPKDGKMAEKSKMKNQYWKKNFNKKPTGWRKKQGNWKEKLKFGSQKYKSGKKSKGEKHKPYKGMKPYKEPVKSSKFKGHQFQDADNNYNRLVKKSVNDSYPEGFTLSSTEETVPEIPPNPDASNITVKRSNGIKRQAMLGEMEVTEEPPNDLKPGAFKAEMFHERVVRKGSTGNGDNVLYTNEKLPLEKKRAIANNLSRRRRKHIEAKFAMKQYFPNKKRRLFKKDVNDSTPQNISTATTSTIYETTVMDVTTIFETEPPITGETEPPTTKMIKKRADRKRFVNSRRKETLDGTEALSKVTNQQIENINDQKGMHLLKMIYRIKEQELESIFDTLNISTSAGTAGAFTTPVLEDVVNMQSSMIKDLVKAIGEKQNHKSDSVRNISIRKKESNMVNATKNWKNISSDNDIVTGTEKRYKDPGTQSIGTSNIARSDLQNVLQLLQKIHKSKNDQGSSSVSRTPTTASSKPATEILIKNLLKNPALLQQLSRNSNKNVENPGILTPTILQLLATSVLKNADQVEKNKVFDKDKGSDEKENQSLDEKLSKMIGENSNTAPNNNAEKGLQFGKDVSEGSMPKDDKNINSEKLKQILAQLSKNNSLVRRSSINRRKARNSFFKYKRIIDRSPTLTTSATTRNATSAITSNITSEISKDSKYSAVSDDVTDNSTEDTDVEDDDDESTTNSFVLTTSLIAATSETEDDSENDAGTEERDDSVESEVLTENDTTLPTEHS